MAYAIRYRYDNEDIWFIGDQPMRFRTMEIAVAALNDEIEECKRAYRLGYMEDDGDFDNYEIVEVTE
jgi:hypothetical protein